MEVKIGQVSHNAKSQSDVPCGFKCTVHEFPLDFPSGLTQVPIPRTPFALKTSSIRCVSGIVGLAVQKCTKAETPWFFECLRISLGKTTVNWCTAAPAVRTSPMGTLAGAGNAKLQGLGALLLPSTLAWECDGYHMVPWKLPWKALMESDEACTGWWRMIRFESHYLKVFSV